LKRYIRSVAFLQRREFLEKYKREDDASSAISLGCYSSFMVAAKVELVSLSARPERRRCLEL